MLGDIESREGEVLAFTLDHTSVRLEHSSCFGLDLGKKGHEVFADNLLEGRLRVSSKELWLLDLRNR